MIPLLVISALGGFCDAAARGGIWYSSSWMVQFSNETVNFVGKQILFYSARKVVGWGVQKMVWGHPKNQVKNGNNLFLVARKLVGCIIPKCIFLTVFLQNVSSLPIFLALQVYFIRRQIQYRLK